MSFKTKGQLLIQVMNYEKILADKQRTVNIIEAADNYSILFYEFFNEQIIFNILFFNKADSSEINSMSTKIYRYSSEFLSSERRKDGFMFTNVHSNLELSSYNE